MEISKRTKNKLLRSKKILDVAESIFMERGVIETTMDEIAIEVGMSKATLYVYYRSKDELFKEIAKRGHKHLLNRFTADIENAKNGFHKVKAMGLTFFSFAQEQPDYYKFLSFFEPKSPEKYQKIATLMVLDVVHLLEKCLKEGIEDGSIKPNVDPSLISKSLWAMASGVVQLISVKGDILSKETGVTPKQMIQGFFDLVEGSIKC
jgi:AcrR family transcriptional regulator